MPSSQQSYYDYCSYAYGCSYQSHHCRSDIIAPKISHEVRLLEFLFNLFEHRLISFQLIV
nr:MAG TPA: hypothetical protein [Caudoviricetes sp.]